MSPTIFVQEMNKVLLHCVFFCQMRVRFPFKINLIALQVYTAQYYENASTITIS